jgi:hypothetical protein
MTNEDWKLQVSIRTSANRDSDMINIRANTAEELSVLLEGIGDYSTQIAAVAKKVQGAYTVLPLSTQNSTTSTTPSGFSNPTQADNPFAGAPAQTPPPASAQPTTPTCVHGARIFRQGVSKTTGKPYAFWACPTPQGTPDQCKPVN